MANEKPADKIKRELAEKQAKDAKAADVIKEELADQHAAEAEGMKEPSAGIDELRSAVAGGEETEGSVTEEDTNAFAMPAAAKTRHELEQHYGEQMKAAEEEVARANTPSAAIGVAGSVKPTGVGMNKLYEIMADMRQSTPDNHTLFGVGNVLFTVGDLRDITGYVR
jgi:hypothetical protein